MQAFFRFSQKNLLPFMLTVLLFPFCGNAQQLPSTWVKGMELTISTGGGMRDQGTETIISDGGCFVINTGIDNNSKKEFTLSQQQLNNLLAVLKKNHFDKITTARRKRIFADMPTANFALNWNGYKIEYSVGASMEVVAKYKQDASRIDAYITNLVNDAVSR